MTPVSALTIENSAHWFMQSFFYNLELVRNMVKGDGPLRKWGLSHSFNAGWRTYYTHIILSPGETADECLRALARAYRKPLSDHVAKKRLRLRLVSTPTFGSHDAIIVWQAKDDDTAKDFVTHALSKLSTSQTLLHAMISGTHG